MATFPQIRAGLTSEAEALYMAMVEAHLASPPGLRRFILTSTLGSGGYSLIFGGKAPFEHGAIDESIVNDLAGYLLIRRIRGGDPTYEISSESLRFYKWLREQRGGAIAAVADAARSLIDSAGYAQAHPTAAGHLEAAFTHLWSDQTDSAAVSAMGHELRSALIDAVNDTIGSPPTKPEDVPGRLKRWTGDAVPDDRERPAVGALVLSAWRLAQRLTHIDDETENTRPLRGHDELRRAAFVVATACYELSFP